MLSPTASAIPRSAAMSTLSLIMLPGTVFESESYFLRLEVDRQPQYRRVVVRRSLQVEDGNHESDGRDLGHARHFSPCDAVRARRVACLLVLANDLAKRGRVAPIRSELPPAKRNDDGES